jgi:hypothetical protein
MVKFNGEVCGVVMYVCCTMWKCNRTVKVEKEGGF